MYAARGWAYWSVLPCDVPFGAKEPKFQLNQLVQKTWFGKTFRGKIIKYNGYLSENRREVDDLTSTRDATTFTRFTFRTETRRTSARTSSSRRR